MLTPHERFVVDISGQFIAIILPIAEYRALLEELCMLKTQAQLREIPGEASAQLARGLPKVDCFTDESISQGARS